MSGPDPSTGLSENRQLLLAAGIGAVLFVLLLGAFGFGGALGFVGVLVYGVLWIGLLALVLWLFYRLVVAVERIAHAQQRIAAAQNPAEGTRATAGDTTDWGDSGGESDDAGEDEADNDTADAVDDGTDGPDDGDADADDDTSGDA